MRFCAKRPGHECESRPVPQTPAAHEVGLFAGIRLIRSLNQDKPSVKESTEALGTTSVVTLISALIAARRKAPHATRSRQEILSLPGSLD
jgi:hypothetical protein